MFQKKHGLEFFKKHWCNKSQKDTRFHTGKTVLCDIVVWFPCTMPVLMGIMRLLSSSSFMVLWLTWPTCGSSRHYMRRPLRANMRSANCCFRYPRTLIEIHCPVF